MADPELSVIIVSYNTRDLLVECLRSLKEHPPKGPHEAIVVDNASSDGSAATVAQDFPGVRCLASRENLGFAAANNRGVTEATGRFLLLLNPDTRVSDGALDAMTAYLDGNPDVGVLGCRQVDERGWPQLCYGSFPTFLGELRRRRETLGLARGDTRCRERVDRRYAAPADVDWVTGACMMMPRRLYVRLAGMDESFWLYFEDVDLCRRVWGAGKRVVYHPGITILHRRDSAMQTIRPVATAAYRAGELRYAALHRPFLAVATLRLRLLVRGCFGWLFARLGKTPGARRWVSRQLLRLALLGRPDSGWQQGPGGVDSPGPGG